MKKILLVDDDENILEPLSLILESEGYQTKTVMDGNDVTKKIKQFNPDLILLDVLMSGSDGRAICKDLKKDKETKNIKIIMMSAHPSAAKDSKECGADDFIAKPFEIDNLVDTLKNTLKS